MFQLWPVHRPDPEPSVHAAQLPIHLFAWWQNNSRAFIYLPRYLLISDSVAVIPGRCTHVAILDLLSSTCAYKEFTFWRIDSDTFFQSNFLPTVDLIYATLPNITILSTDSTSCSELSRLHISRLVSCFHLKPWGSMAPSRDCWRATYKIQISKSHKIAHNKYDIASAIGFVESSCGK